MTSFTNSAIRTSAGRFVYFIQTAMHDSSK